MTEEKQMKIETPAFRKGEAIPEKYTYEGMNVSPGITWENAPEGTQSLVLIAEDPDAPSGNWVHWLVYNVPPEKHALQENIDGIPSLGDGTLQGINDFRKIGYGGPLPPKGSGPHRYFFRLYALDTKLSIRPGASRAEVERAMQGHILGKTETLGKFAR